MFICYGSAATPQCCESASMQNSAWHLFFTLAWVATNMPIHYSMAYQHGLDPSQEEKSFTALFFLFVCFFKFYFISSKCDRKWTQQRAIQFSSPFEKNKKNHVNARHVNARHVTDEQQLRFSRGHSTAAEWPGDAMNTLWVQLGGLNPRGFPYLYTYTVEKIVGSGSVDS